jgi:hypothetical protein
MANFLNMSSDFLSNSTAIVPYTFVQVVDDEMRRDIHNGMILISTTLGVVLAELLAKGYCMYRSLRGQVPSKQSEMSSLTNVVSVNAP